MIRASNLNYSIGSTQILKSINVEFHAGEFVGIIGANGSGKTTLLKCLSGLYETKNQVFVEEQPIESFSHRQRAKEIAFMKQSISISFDLSCYEVIAMGRYAYLKGMSPLTKQDEKIINEVMEQTKTKEFANRSIRHLSGGERQRVMLAKALVQKTPYLILDEPSSALDVKYEQQIFRFAKELQSDQRCIIMSIHNIQMAIRYCSRIILLKDGEVLVDGSAHEVITEENLATAYDVQTKVYMNPVTGYLDFMIV